MMELQILPILKMLSEAAVYFIVIGIVIVLIFLCLFLKQCIQLLKTVDARIQQAETSVQFVNEITENVVAISHSANNISSSVNELQDKIIGLISKSSVNTMAIVYRVLKERKLKKQLEGGKNE